MVTKSEYSAMEKAYNHFNRKLFGGSLPSVLITLHRRPKSRGYFRAESFHARTGADSVHELALNPEVFVGRTDEEILSTLVHEMVHVWQQEHGRAPRRCYHDREWAGKMKEVGLYPSSTGEPGGKEVGQHMTHYIVEGGPFVVAAKSLIENGWALGYESPEPGSQRKSGAASSASKTKFTCPGCQLNAWAKPSAILVCGHCAEDGELHRLLVA